MVGTLFLCFFNVLGNSKFYLFSKHLSFAFRSACIIKKSPKRVAFRCASFIHIALAIAFPRSAVVIYIDTATDKLGYLDGQGRFA